MSIPIFLIIWYSLNTIGSSIYACEGAHYVEKNVFRRYDRGIRSLYGIRGYSELSPS